MANRLVRNKAGLACPCMSNITLTMSGGLADKPRGWSRWCPWPVPTETCDQPLEMPARNHGWQKNDGEDGDRHRNVYRFLCPNKLPSGKNEFNGSMMSMSCYLFSTGCWMFAATHSFALNGPSSWPGPAHPWAFQLRIRPTSNGKHRDPDTIIQSVCQPTMANANTPSVLPVFQSFHSC